MKNTYMGALKAVSVLSGYNWYKITADNTEGSNRIFFATALEAQFNGETIKADRQFASPVYIAGYDSVTATAENCVVFHMPNGGSYTVEGENKNLTAADNYNGNFQNMEALLNDPATLERLTDYDRSHKDENGNLFVVVDLRKLGRITAAAGQKIRSFLNVYCGGKVQNPRTLCIKFCPDTSIITGIWDYVTEQPSAGKMFIADENTEKALYKVAQSVAAAL